MITGFVLCAVSAYLLGSLNFAIIISGKSYKQDIREFGSKNAGMTNMMRTYGKKAAALTLLGDALKAIVSGLIGYALLGQLGAYVAGCACVIGHIFPVFYKFKGGKGVVTAAMSILMCNPFVFVIILLFFIVIVAATKYISLGSIMCVLVYPFILSGVDTWLSGGCPYVPFALLISVIIIFKHKDNIKRLRAGTENKFSFKKSVKTNKDK
ncbi:MAG: glycerol-3-phosphate 1-O-acyltransferase PlsY [Clostridia bacterium]|nr:glycerol-3-phosphate 1-O-acyltransferase PlsY [Clostridia bacterium]